jgi:hypothetical protein
MEININEVLASFNEDYVFNTIVKKYNFKLQVFIDFYIENFRYILVLNENIIEKDNFLFHCALKIGRLDNSINQISKPKNDEVCLFALGLINKSRLNMIESFEKGQKIEFKLVLT